jgi:hypothetical protein
MKCDVCGKETKTTVCCSACGAISFAYCDECLHTGREPYSALIGMGLYSRDINETFKHHTLLPSLQFYNKTIEQFDADVKAFDDDYAEYCKEQAERGADNEEFIEGSEFETQAIDLQS